MTHQEIEMKLKYLEETVENLNKWNNERFGGQCETYKKAIKSLEAWDKVIADIKNMSVAVNDGTNHYYKDTYETIAEVLCIIRKHLGEVEE